MGIQVVLETEDGDAIETVEDPTNILGRLLPEVGDSRYVCLGVIDWYGDTVFNCLQIERFILEWDRATESAAEADRGFVVAVRKMAERLRRERHVYLKFYGD